MPIEGILYFILILVIEQVDFTFVKSKYRSSIARDSFLDNAWSGRSTPIFNYKCVPEFRITTRDIELKSLLLDSRLPACLCTAG